MAERKWTILMATIPIAVVGWVVVVIFMSWADTRGWPFRLVLAVGCLVSASLPPITYRALKRWWR